MRGSETVLIAEDQESIREMARQTLLSLGYRVLSACDGQEALRLCEKEAPALAILDVLMPKLGGGHSREAPCSVRQSPDFVHPRLFARLQQRRPRCYRRALPAKALQPHHTRPDRSGNSRRGQKPRRSAVSARLPEIDEPSFFHSVSPRLASISFFAVDTCVSQCYKPEKDKPLGGESPNVLPIAVRE
jgi:CheY-like chemotaxis protein